jgi:hypothetical protein
MDLILIIQVYQLPKIYEPFPNSRRQKVTGSMFYTDDPQFCSDL